MKVNTKMKIYVCILLISMLTYLLPTDIISVQDNIAYADEADFFKSMIITKGGAIGVEDVTTVVDLVAGTPSEWLISTNTDYYLNFSAKPTSDSQYIRVSVGSETDGKYSGDGVIYTNIPGGVWEKGPIASDYLSELTSYKNYVDPTYGKDNTTQCLLRDGELIYKVKSDFENREIPLNIGFQIKDELFTGGNIINAIIIDVGKYLDNKFISTQSYSVSLNMSQKNTIVSHFKQNTATSTLGGVGQQIIFYPADNNGLITSAILFDAIGFDMTYPQGAELEIGFTQYNKANPFSKESSIHGLIRQGDAVQNEDGTQTVHYTIGRGFKAIDKDVVLYTRLNFPKNHGFSEGQVYKLQASNLSCIANGKSVNIGFRANYDIVRYTLISDKIDYTKVSAIDRTEVYNNSIDSLKKDYLVSLGGVNIVNPSESNMTPYEKTYEAFFNTTNTAACITTVTVPIGCDSTGKIKSSISVEWTGIDENGDTKSGTFIENKYLGSDKPYIILYADSLGIESFTGVKADIGYLYAGFSTSISTSGMSPDFQKTGTWGYFTTNEAGIVVRNTYLVYNTDSSSQDKSNGYFKLESVAISTDKPLISFLHNISLTKINNTALNPTVTIKPGTDATITGLVYPFYGLISGFNNTTCIYNPIVYLTLPQGISFDEDNMIFSLTKGGREEVIPHSIENVSYLNKSSDNVSIYRITFPKDTLIGYLSKNNISSVTALSYSVTLKTSKSLPTRRYSLNELICITATNQPAAYSGSSSTFVSIVDDKYGLNGGKAMSGVFRDVDNNKGMALQQLAEINIYTATTITKINDKEAVDILHNYDVSDPNSIAILGSNSQGRLRLRISNTSDNAMPVKVLLPIPKKGQDLGDAFMVEEQQFDLDMTYNSDLSPTGFSVQYVSITGKDDISSSMPAYTAVEDKNNANGFLIMADSVAKGDNDLFFDFEMNNGQVNETNIWRPVYSYESSDGTRNNTGAYSACSVATSSISGVVFNDINRDGLMNPGEEGIPNVTVVTKDSKNRIISAITDENGAYSFLAVRNEELAMTFSIVASSNLRFNVQATSVEGASSVNPSANGLIATKNFQADSKQYIVNAAVASYYTLCYDKNGGNGFLPPDSEYIMNSDAIVAVKADNLIKKGYNFIEWNTKSDGTGAGYIAGQTIKITGNTKLYAIWSIASYTVSFNYSGATEDNSETSRIIQYNNMYGELPNPSKTGYEFMGWCSIINGSKSAVYSTTKFTTGSDIVLYAQWKPKSGFTVNYNTTSGAAIECRNVSWDDTVLPESTPTRTGYTFAGWKYNDITVTDTNTFGVLAKSETNNCITLTAQWKPKTGYSVIYNTNGGNSIDTLINVNWNQNLLLPAINPAQEGYAFIGWTYKGSYINNSHTYDSLASNDTDTSITLVAQWRKIEDEKVIHYITGNGATIYPDKVLENISSDSLIPTNEPVRRGYAFTGWYTEENSAGILVSSTTTYGAIQASGDSINIFAGWTEKTYTINYDTKTTELIEKKLNVKFYNSDILPVVNPNRSGYSFAGWFYEGNKVTNETKISELIPNDDLSTITLTAFWKEKAYTINYNSQSSTSYSAKSGVCYNTSGFIPDTPPIKTGYTFDGWFYGDKEAKALTKISELIPNDIIGDKITLTAKWSPKEGYTVYYNTNGGTPATISDKTAVKWTDNNLLPTEDISRNGYKLSGWVCGRINVTASTAYGDLTAIDTLGTSITLVAQWEENNYTVKYNTSGGTPATITDKTNVKWTQNNLLPTDNPIKVGYSFKEWRYNDTLVSSDTKYSDLVSDDTTMTITLVANWIVKGNYTVEYNTDGGSSIDSKTNVSWTQTNLLPTSNPVKAGYTFNGWVCNDTAVTSSTKYSDLVSNDTTMTVTLKANWTVNNYTVVYNTDGGTPATISDKTNVSWTQTNLLPTSNPVKAGYTFNGWKCNDTVVLSDTKYSDLVSDDTTMTITLVAQWEEKSYTVKYDTSGGTPATISDKTNVKWTQENLLPSVDVNKTGYTLSWKYGNQVVDSTTTYAALVNNNDSIASITLAANWTPIEYKVQFNSNGGTGNMEQQSFIYDNEARLKLNTFSRNDYSFVGWNTTADGAGISYADEQTVNNLADTNSAIVNLYAQWTQNTHYNVSGFLENDIGERVADAKVSIMNGLNEIASTKTDYLGNYSLIDIPAGTYNIVIDKLEQKITSIITITDSDIMNLNLELASEKKNSSLILTQETNANLVPNIVVGGLDIIAENQTVNTTIELTITQEVEKPNDTEQLSISNIASGHQLDIFLDTVLNRITEDPYMGTIIENIGDNNEVVLEILIPYDFTDKSDIKIWRHHGGSASELTKLIDRPLNNFLDGTYYYDTTEGLIHIYAKKFSTYAISYNTVINNNTPVTQPDPLYSVKISDTICGGEVLANKEAATSGMIVNITIKPNDMYKLATLNIVDCHGNSILYNKIKNNEYSFKMPLSDVKIYATFVQKPWDPEATGVKLLLQTDDHISYIGGYADGTVKPENNMTRGEVAMMLYRLLRNKDIQATTAFKDVPDSLWCSTAVNTLASLGIIKGYGNELFGPDDKITREQFCTMVIKFTSVNNIEYNKEFIDVTPEIWSYNSIMTAASLGFINGYSNDTFCPKDSITRAQAVTIINHILGRSADTDYIALHTDKITLFTDLNDNLKWYYYDMIEATNIHDYIKNDNGDEQWSIGK